jgi:serine/threonine protein kinase
MCPSGVWRVIHTGFWIFVSGVLEFGIRNFGILHTGSMAPTAWKIIQRLSTIGISANSCPNDSIPPFDEPVAAAGVDMCVCRLCEESIPLFDFGAHTQSCVQLYQNATLINEIDDRIRTIQNAVAERFLNVPWPGDEQTQQRTLPALHLHVLLTRALAVDPHISDSGSELAYIASVLSTFIGRDLADLVLSVHQVLHEKARSSRAAAMAIAGTRRRRQMTPHLVAGTSIADFTFIKRISRGAFGTVFLARRERTGDIFAIKATPQRLLKQKNQIQRLEVERDILLRFSSPYIVRFYYSFVGTNNCYLVTEFVPGGDLFSLLENVSSLDEDAAKFYGIQVLYALKHLRLNGIIHRDIKPDNILVTAEGRLKLTDFGLSYLGVVGRHSDDDVVATTRSIVGTPDYVAPEIILSRPHSFAADYWSLGAMLYEFVYGVPPFHGSDERETYHNIMFNSVKFAEDTPVSPEFVDLIQKLLDPNELTRLGNRDIADIIAHPWFQDIDISGPAPFIPELGSATDTTYFEQKYSFDHDEDASIRADLTECTGTPTPASLSGFSSIDVKQLGLANLAVAERLTGQKPSDVPVTPVVPEEAPSVLPGRTRHPSIQRPRRQASGIVDSAAFKDPKR